MRLRIPFFALFPVIMMPWQRNDLVSSFHDVMNSARARIARGREVPISEIRRPARGMVIAPLADNGQKCSIRVDAGLPRRCQAGTCPNATGGHGQEMKDDKDFVGWCRRMAKTLSVLRGDLLSRFRNR